MKKVFYPLVLGPLCLVFLLGAGKKPPPTAQDYLDKAVLAQGGRNPLERVETLSYDFQWAEMGEGRPVSRRGRHYYRKTKAGWLGREEMLSAEGKATAPPRVWNSAFPGAAEDPLKEILFVLLAPYELKKASAAVSYGGLVYFQGKLLRQLVAEKAPESPLFKGGSCTLYLDTTTFRVDGLVLGGKGEAPPKTWVLGTFREHSKVRFPTHLVHYTSEEWPRENFFIRNLVVNSFLEPQLFEAARPSEP